MLDLENGALVVDTFTKLCVADQAVLLKELRARHLDCKIAVKLGRQLLAQDRKDAKALKQQQAIVRAQERLQRLLDKQAGKVGSKAIKANRKPGKVTVTYGAEDNAIAKAIMDRKAKASA